MYNLWSGKKSFSHSAGNENDDNTMLALKTSYDGINWTDYKRLSDGSYVMAGLKTTTSSMWFMPKTRKTANLP